jgi:Arc/MetJ-type ribon-helix-helix transcriptional regulator
LIARRPNGQDVINEEAVPKWYRYGMSIQIAVRLPKELAEFVDQQVRTGEERSRAAVVVRSLERERRRRLAERDAAILSRGQSSSDMEALAAAAADTPLGLE